ncbi:MAG: hypothetical protein WCT04_12530 [Planctomycetota bacterium]
MSEPEDTVRELVTNLIRLRSDLSGIRDLANTVALQTTTLSARFAEQKAWEQSAQLDLRNALATRAQLDEQHRSCQAKQTMLERRIQSALEEHEKLFSVIAATDSRLAPEFLEALRTVDITVMDNSISLLERIGTLESRLEALETRDQMPQQEPEQPQEPEQGQPVAAINRATDTQKVPGHFLSTEPEPAEELPAKSSGSLKAPFDNVPVAQAVVAAREVGSTWPDGSPEEGWNRWEAELERLHTRQPDLPDFKALWRSFEARREYGTRFRALHDSLKELDHWDEQGGTRDTYIRARLKLLYDWLKSEIKTARNASPVYSTYQRMVASLEPLEREPGMSESVQGAVKNASDVLRQWALFMDKECRWWDAAEYDQRVARAATDLFDQLVGESLENRWKGILTDMEAFLRLYGVRRDLRLKNGMKHGELPPVLQNHFQENTHSSGLHVQTAQCRIGRILHHRWMLVGSDGREVDITKPLYQFTP